MSLPKKLFRGSVAQTLMTLVNIAVGLFMLPFMVSQLGESLYGFWILIGGFTASLYLFDFGFATAVTRFMSRFISQGEEDAANRVINSALLIYTGLALLVLVATLTIAAVSKIWVEDPSNVDMVRLLVFLAGLGLVISFPFKAFAGIGAAYVRYDLMAWTRIAIKLITTAFTIIALLSGYKLIAVALVQLGGSIASDLATLLIAKYLFKPLRLKADFIDRETIRSLAGYSGWAFLLDLTKLIKGKADIFIIGGLLGTGPLTIYYVAVRLVEYSLDFLTKATGMTTPVFAGYQAREDYEGLRSKTVIFIRINLLLGAFAAYGLILLGEPLIRIWMGSEFNFHSAYEVLAIMIVGRIVAFVFAPLSNVLMAISKPRLLAYLSMFEAVVSLVLIYPALVFLEAGIAGAAVAIVLPFFVTRTLILPIIIQRQIDLHVSRLYRNLLKPVLLLIVSSVIANSILLDVLKASNFWSLLGSALIISALYWALMLPSLTKEEWAYIRKMLPDKLNRHSGKTREKG